MTMCSSKLIRRLRATGYEVRTDTERFSPQLQEQVQLQTTILLTKLLKVELGSVINNFIDEYQIDKDQWVEGYSTLANV